MEFKLWRHVFKLDPSKEISDDHLEKICESGTDGIIVGGTDGVTLDNVLNLLVRVRRYAVPVGLEISNLESISLGFDYYFIPTVLNSNESKWFKDLHHAAIKEVGHMIDWDELVAEGYCILNPDCKVANVTGANTSIDVEDVIGYARMAEHFFKLPIFYLEYSGAYGDPSLVKEAKEVLNNTRLFYGGGIRNAEQAMEMAAIADTVVIGNVIYDDINAAISTVKSVKSVSTHISIDV